MKINKVICVFVVALVLLSGGCVKNGVGKLEVNVGEESLYECSDGSTVKAYFCNLSDDSLNFVKVNMENKEYTLPQLVSASGARYSDEREVEFWIKGDEVTISRMNDNGEWNVVKTGKIKK